MITTHRTTRGIKIKVVKYNDFQNLGNYKSIKNCIGNQTDNPTDYQFSNQLGNPTIVKNDNNDNNIIYNGFKEPTLEEVKKYCEERQNNVNPQKFIDFYKSKGWMVGKNKMKDWKACVRTWEGNSFENRDNLKVASGKYNNIKKTTINDNSKEI